MTKSEREIAKLRARAYHEAGHAVIALDMRRGVRLVSIISDEGRGSLGHCQNDRLPNWFNPDILIEFRARCGSRMRF